MVHKLCFVESVAPRLPLVLSHCLKGICRPHVCSGEINDECRSRNPLAPCPQSKITREELEERRQLLVDLRHEIGELKSIHQAGVVGSKGGGTRGGYGTAMPASEFFKQGQRWR